MRTCLLLCLSVAGLLSAADRKIVITGTPQHWWAFTEDALRQYREAGSGVDIVVAKPGEQFAREIADADAVIGGISRDLFARAKKLKWVQTYSAGVEDYRWPEFLNSSVVLTNCKIVQGPTIADHAMALLLSLTRDLHRFQQQRSREEWNRDGQGLTELQDMTAVVIGVGGIGSQIAQRARGFGMNVIGVDPKDIAPGSTVSRVVRPDQLNEVLPQADVVFVSAPLTPESERMIGQRQFDLMKAGAYFIAVSRGRLYDTAALVKALDSRKLAGAGLDVTDPEPLPRGHPLWKFPNVVITPHVASQSPGSHRRRVEVVRENIVRFVRGQALRNVVDKQKGY
jgi:phosphoglycerate dehydrogenase-like enzyme